MVKTVFSLKAGFEAMLAPVPDIGDGEERYIVSGLEYGDGNYVWVAQYKVSVVNEIFQGHNDLKHNFKTGVLS